MKNPGGTGRIQPRQVPGWEPGVYQNKPCAHLLFNTPDGAIEAMHHRYLITP